MNESIYSEKSAYIEKTEAGGLRIRGTRVSLDSIVYAFLDGEPAESIVRSFPTLRLEQVYGAITYYLSNRVEIDAYLQRAHDDFEAQRQSARDRDPAFYRKLAEAKTRHLPL